MVEPAATRAIRLLDLVPYLVSHSGISVTSLAKEFGVGKEEMLKDLNLLFMCGLPGYTPLELIDISFDDEVVVVRDPQNLSSPRNLTESESIALRIALSALLEMTPRTTPNYLKIVNLSKKISSSFANHVPSGAIEFTADRERASIETIERALNENLDIEIEYVNRAKDEITRRVVTPRYVSLGSHRPALSGYCHSARAERSFLIFNIAAIKMVQRTEIEGVLPVSSEDALTVEISVESSEIDFIASNRDLLSQVGKNRYQLEVFQDEWIIRSVLSEAAGLQLLKPTTVRDAVKKRAEDALHLYGR
jgi:predicted DNA-binding transcriptional regulator YafY